MASIPRTPWRLDLPEISAPERRFRGVCFEIPDLAHAQKIRDA
jgi:hypothetical protein